MLIPAMRIDRYALHIFHHQVGQPFDTNSSIQQTPDVGVIQLGQDLPLHAKPEQHVMVAAEIGAHQFDGDLLLVDLVGAAGEVHSAHAAIADDTDHSPGTD